MQLEHQFTVPASPEVVWAAVVDPAKVAPCMPGATLTEVNDSEFSGSVKVKLGPVSLLYKGSGQFVEIDEQSKRVVIKASGKDSRGNGTASATVTLTLSGEGETTHGSVLTDLAITGKPAQFGRGMISEVGGKILDTFAGCLAGKLGASPEAVEEAAKPAPRRRTRTSAATKTETAATTSTTAAAKPAARSTAAAKPAEEPKAETQPEPKTEAAKPAPKPAPAAAKAEPAAEPTPAAAPVSAAATNGAVTSVNVRSDENETPRLRVVEQEPETEAIDLLDYAGPSVLKRAVPLVVGLLVLFLIIRRLRKR